MKVLICGGRQFNDWKLFYFMMDGIIGIDFIISGGATGADTMAVDYAKRNAIPHKVYMADWTKHGRGAGPKRNQLMLDDGKPDLVIAFPGGRGTDDMVRRAGFSGVKVIRL